MEKISQDLPKFGKQDSLISQASVDRLQNAAIRQEVVRKLRKEIAESPEYSQILQKLNDEGVELLFSSDADATISIAVVLSAEEDSAQFLSTILMECGMNGVHVNQLQVRPELEGNGSYIVTDARKISKVKFEIFANCECTKNAFLKVATFLTDRYCIQRLNIYDSTNGMLKKIPWFPKHIVDLDKCHHCVLKYEPTSDPRHPGYGDHEYVQRRQQLNNLAKAYKYGEKFPNIEYNEEEHKTWEVVFNKLKEFHLSHACVEYQQKFKQMELEGLLEPNRIPKLHLINKYLRQKTGFTLRPCAGLLSARDFLASLAFRVFQTTIYIRHSGSPHHSPEPDLIHEFIGHCPMFAHPLIAQFSQQIGLLSLGATDEQIEQLATVYWFTIEFGLCRQNGELKAFGAGLLSSYGELLHACSDAPQHEAFDPQRAALQKYEDFDYQPVYFVADSIFDALIKLRIFAQNFQRPFVVTYDPYTESVKVVKETEEARIESFRR